MSDTATAAKPVDNQDAAPKIPNLRGGDDTIVDGDGKETLLSPRKRNRTHSEARERSSSPAKRQKGVAPIKSELALPVARHCMY